MTEHTLNCTGSFDLVTPPINCWNKQGHGEIEIREAIEQSCNVLFQLRLVSNLVRMQTETFQKTRSPGVYCRNMLPTWDLDQKTGIEITEAAPQVSDSTTPSRPISDRVPMRYTTSQLARYATAIATSVDDL